MAYVLKPEGIFLRKRLCVYKADDGHLSPLGGNDLCQELLDFFTREIRGGRLKKEDVGRLHLFANGYRDHMEENVLAYMREFHYSISCGNTTLEISSEHQDGLVAVPVHTGMKFDKDGRIFS